MSGHTENTGNHAAVNGSQKDHDVMHTHLLPRLLLLLTPPPILLPLALSTRTLRPLFSAVWEKKRGGGDEEERKSKEGKKKKGGE